jgi:tetratricopeptide (TPR) repeat protein
MQVFVGHAHADNELCDRYVAALRARGLDVWYDRTNMQVGHSLSTDIEAELRQRTAFVVIATPASLASQWVRSEIAAFRSLAAHDPTRLFLPVRAAECEMPLLWADIRGIDAVSLDFDAAVDAMAVVLGAGAVTSASTPEPVEREEELREKLALIDDALAVTPMNANYWESRVTVLAKLGRYDEAREAEKNAKELQKRMRRS